MIAQSQIISGPSTHIEVVRATSMKLHWSPRSPFVRKVLIVAHETGQFDRLEKVRSVVAMTKPNEQLMRVNPFNKIPTLVLDDGRILFDSDLISEYLDSLHSGTKMVPSDSSEHWQALCWRAFGNEMLDALILWRNEQTRPNGTHLQILLNAFELKIRTALDFLERDAESLTQAPFSVGQISIGCALAYMNFRFAHYNWRKARPKIAHWFSEFEQRPSVKLTEPKDE